MSWGSLRPAFTLYVARSALCSAATPLRKTGGLETLNGVSLSAECSFYAVNPSKRLPFCLLKSKHEHSFRRKARPGYRRGERAGIGYGIAKALAAGGAETTALSRTQEDLDRLKAESTLFLSKCVMVEHNWFVESNGSGVELRTLGYENPSSNPVMRC
ncbi:hypothetical protein NP493_296g00032 [Ridgeia piscesae]|uniref:Uncharacterized protein n=1 Tax=Ridgeia piscesae TaxID=27915 RepID=A0AAD9NWI6_RIDPI|nr:hypothetical protein NP493_296g00032 [Ridgeia piscesae]